MDSIADIMERYKKQGDPNSEVPGTSQNSSPKKRNRVECTTEDPREDPLDLSGSVWDSKVFLSPSQPIDIPPRDVPVTPTTGVPKKSILHKILTKDWYHDKDDELEEECLDAPFSSAPLRRVLSSESFAPKMKSNWPNIIYRLSFVLNMLARPDIVLDSVTVPPGPQLENPWFFPLKDIHEKRKSNKPVSVAEAALYSGTKGFLYMPILRGFNRLLVSRRYRSTVIENELIISQPWMAAHPNYCVFCQTIHSRVGHNHPHNCYYVNANGPRTIIDLMEDKSWLPLAKALLLGYSNLYYMPYSLKHKIVNIACLDEGDYLVPARAQDINNTPITHEKSLIYRINKAIQLVGQASKLPILIEFYENGKFPAANLALHLAGFAQAVRYCQPNYNGPIIIVIPPIKAVMGETEESYTIKKSRLAQVQNYGHLIGLATGVPIIHVQVQVTQYTEIGESLNYGTWIPEPLFGSKGTHTREYMSRLHIWFEALQKVLNGEIAIGMDTLFLRPINTKETKR